MGRGNGGECVVTDGGLGESGAEPTKVVLGLADFWWPPVVDALAAQQLSAPVT